MTKAASSTGLHFINLVRVSKRAGYSETIYHITIWRKREKSRPMKRNTKNKKPPYHVPMMAEVRKLEKRNGLKVATTFAGCGGSCLGYRMAGFDVIWANEFWGKAADTYEANSKVKVNRTDIKKLTAKKILKELGMKKGELDLFDGSPPCQTFSTAGKREMSDPRSDLFFDYIRLVEGIKPKVFVAENVSGMVKGVAKGMFKIIMKELKAAGYTAEARLLDAQWLGVPQVRKRVIFVGVRKDLKKGPKFPDPLPYRYSVADALPWITRVVQDPRGQFRVTDQNGSKPCDPITVRNVSHIKVEAKILGNSSYKETKKSADKIPAHMIMSQGASKTSGYIEAPIPPEADISGTCLDEEWDRLKPGGQSDKYFSLVRPDPKEPCPTVTKIGGQSAGVACVTHPTEKRKFTIPELRRIMSFPDDFEQSGSYANQWAVLGNAVPPLMMRAVAETIAKKIFDVKKKRSAKRKIKNG